MKSGEKCRSDKRTILLEGSPKERGLTYGESCKKLINEVIERWKYSLHKGVGKDPNHVIDLFIEETEFYSTVSRVAPHLLREVEGIGEGADVEFNTVFALQCMDEQWWFFPEYQALTKHQGCSVIGSLKNSGNPTLLSQNMDIPHLFQGTDVLLKIKHRKTSTESYIYTLAGMIALCGLSNKPLGICCNTLIDLNHSPTGYPVAFIVRSVLEQPNLGKALNIINQVQHASGQNYTIGDPERIIALECSANKKSQHAPFKDEGRVFHTNHPEVNDDLIFPPREGKNSGTSHARFNYLNFRVDPLKEIDENTIKGILSSHEGPICVHPENTASEGYTFGSLLYILSDTPELLLARGPPCQTPYEAYAFN